MTSLSPVWQHTCALKINIRRPKFSKRYAGGAGLVVLRNQPEAFLCESVIKDWLGFRFTEKFVRIQTLGI